jgi:aerobic carbon-monoxide dehydrogenase medium subunit
MVPPRFDYAAPLSLDEAVALLNENKGAQILAGGHTLLSEVKLRRMSPPMLVDLRKIRSLYGISRRREEGSGSAR